MRPRMPVLAIAFLLAACGIEPPDDSPGEGDVGTSVDDLYTKALPSPSCTDQSASWVPQGGYNGGMKGYKACGPTSPTCPTTYVNGNIGAACTTTSQCSGLHPVCLGGTKYPGGYCSSTGCELGTNFGCPAGDTCVSAGTQTYCFAGCGWTNTGCFMHCDRSGYSCFATESRYLGFCASTTANRKCDPTKSQWCDPTTTGVGPAICVQTGWDNQTVGQCFETCDPVLQDCQTPNTGCYATEGYNPNPVCFGNWGRPEGASCTRLTMCAAGLTCACNLQDGSCHDTYPPHDMVCRHYCDPGYDYGPHCPTGQFCHKIPNWPYGNCKPW
jgi:hypothetical protein